MYKSVCVLGRQPALGLAELESIYGATFVGTLGDNCAGLLLETDDVDFSRLGGSIKLASVIGELDSSDWNKVEKSLISLVRSTAFALPTSGKFHLGLSVHGFRITPAKLTALALTLKKVIRSRDISVRTVPNQIPELSSAQVYHNKLATDHGAEILIIANGSTTVLARTVAVQDIDSYTLRDRGRPRRDARVGMLPPKLAQIIVNLAVGQTDKAQDVAVLDPFCGTGVVLQEAMLMGYRVYGTDLEPRMISYSQANLDWFVNEYDIPNATDKPPFRLEVGDATSHHWDPAHSFVACETYLGRPFTERPAPDILARTMGDVNLIIKKFLRNIHYQLEPGDRLCLAVPAWFINQEPRHLPLLATVDELGYKRVSLTHARENDLVYHREGQIVGRELVILTVAS